MRPVTILGVGHYTPSYSLSNDELSTFVDTNDEWIFTRTGIRARCRVAPGEYSHTMGVQAGRVALERAGLSPQEVGLLICSSITPENPVPGVSPEVREGLGLSCPVQDVSVACSGFVYAMGIASEYIAQGLVDYALVVGCDAMTRTLNWEERSTCVLFGDAAGAVVLGPAQDGQGIQDIVYGADGKGGENLVLQGAVGDFCPAREAGPSKEEFTIQMDGRGVYRFAVQIFEQIPLLLAHNSGWDIQDVDLFVPHQANERILRGAMKRLGLVDERVVINIASYGNTVNASVPLALSEAYEAGRVQSGDKVILLGFGGGLAWSGISLVWS